MRNWIFALLIFILATACGDQTTYALIDTTYGPIKIKLYDDTPLHKENFVKLAEEGFYDSLLFHRVMNNFMIQGGDPRSKTAATGQQLGDGGPGYTLPAEIGYPHLRGAVAAARLPDGANPQKESSGSQFFIVQAGPQSDQILDAMEAQKGFKYNADQRQAYKTLGGYPSLDMDYTVFGEVVEGMEVVDKIANVQRDQANRPMENIMMTVKIID